MRIAFIADSGIKRLFTGIDSSSDIAGLLSSTQLIYSFVSFFICLFISLSLLIFFFSNRSLGTFFHKFRIPFPFPDSGFRVLVLPVHWFVNLARKSGFFFLSCLMSLFEINFFELSVSPFVPAFVIKKTSESIWARKNFKRKRHSFEK